MKHTPADLLPEVFETLLDNEHLKIERIISKGHTSPESGWYDQAQHEWVILLEGAATITFDNGKESNLRKGDYLNIPAHVKHKVSWTDPDVESIWLAVFYGDIQ
ncbi:cupin domain-containing protein [Ghiorsea bivora]|uniref:cupin domain-containing protein n=1 Tax=Ghiorsea bivora TaxID=1485545 RepID=UPI0005707CB1|nr:cupin domain-containing protein [Ghiorsea bivora]